MKRLTTLALLFTSFNINAQIGIGTQSPAPSAMLEVKSTTLGFLPPRMTQAQRNAILNPATGLIIFCSNCGSGESQFFNGKLWVNMVGNTATDVVITPTITSITGQVWMDRNLGASRVALSAADSASYGDLYQWGRGADGHQLRTSAITSALSTANVPGNTNFIKAPNSPYDWRSPQNDDLWQGVNGVNNPCPLGFRIPTSVELDLERIKFSNPNSTGAFASQLKLPAAGRRLYSTGAILDVGSTGIYWSSTVSYSNELCLNFNSSTANILELQRGTGGSVRCIKH